MSVEDPMCLCSEDRLCHPSCPSNYKATFVAARVKELKWCNHLLTSPKFVAAMQFPDPVPRLVNLDHLNPHIRSDAKLAADMVVQETRESGVDLINIFCEALKQIPGSQP